MNLKLFTFQSPNQKLFLFILISAGTKWHVIVGFIHISLTVMLNIFPCASWPLCILFEKERLFKSFARFLFGSTIFWLSTERILHMFLDSKSFVIYDLQIFSPILGVVFLLKIVLGA